MRLCHIKLLWDLSQQQQQQQQHTSLFGTPPPPLPVPSVPMKEPPGYEEAMKQQPKAQVRAVLFPLESRCKVAVVKPFRFLIRASKRERRPNCPFLSPLTEGSGAVPLAAPCTTAPPLVPGELTRPSSPQENGCSSQQMDDLFDILIESGGKEMRGHFPALGLQPGSGRALMCLAVTALCSRVPGRH